MAGRRIQPEVQSLFEKYVTNTLHVRRLEPADALVLLQKEFLLTPRDSRELLDHFDADNNGSLSLWEFQHFYTLAGASVADTAAQFDELDRDKKRSLTRDQIQDALRSMTSADGANFEDKDIEMILKSAKDPDNITLGDFIALLYRTKRYKKAPAKR